jgi:Fur family transcriptional regulator, peroxide stress response regulator
METSGAERLKVLEEICRRSGLAWTFQRSAVLEVLLERSDHPTADQIFETVRERTPQISRRTVYRVLDTVAELGLIRRVHHPGAAARFDAKTHRHHHLVCMRCNKIVDWEDAELDNMVLPAGRPRGFDVCDFSVQLMGLCPDCRSEKAKENEK